MACFETRHCFTCNQDYSTDLYSGGGCPHCAAAEAEAKRVVYFASLDKLPLEERVRKIEEWIYDHRQVRHGYISPPKC